MASSAAEAPSTHPRERQTPAWQPAWRDAVERRLEAERDRLPLWVPVMLGVGVASWFALPRPTTWWAAGLAMVALALSGAAFARGGRGSRAVLVGGLAMALGLALMA